MQYFEEIWKIFVRIFRIWKWLNVVRFVLCIVLESVAVSSGIPCLEFNFWVLAFLTIVYMPNFNQESYIIELMQDYLTMLSKLPHPRISSCCDIFRQHILYSSPPYYDDIVMLRLALRSSRQECGPWHLLSN